MLGTIAVVLLVLVAFTPVILIDALAESFVVSFDKEFYSVGDGLEISGEILDYGMPIIAMSVYDPNGKILSANNLEISTEKTFSKSLLLDSEFYEKAGEYTVQFDYGQTSEEFLFIIDSEFSETEVIIEELFEPEIILLYTEKAQYSDGETIVVTGLVSNVESPTVLIGIYDPFGLPAGFYFGTINSDLEFSTNFLVKSGVNFRTEGTYSIKAHYGESEATSFFDYFENIPETTTENIPETTTENIPETTTENIPETTTENIPETTTENIPETTTENIPETTTENIPETTIIEKPTKDKESSKPNSSTESEITEIFSTKTNNELDNQSKTNSDEFSMNDKHLDNKKQNNLTVEDIELGKILNQINLECDNSKFTDTITYYDGMGPALYRLCNFENSLNFFNDSLIKDPENVEVLVNKGSTLGKLGYYSESIEYYNQAIKVNPDFLPAKNNKANALAYLGNEKEAIMIYEEILDANPNYITARKNLEILKSEFNDNVQPMSNNFETVPIVYTTTEITSPEIKKQIISQKEKPSNFFDEVSVVLGSLFGFLN